MKVIVMLSLFSIAYALYTDIDENIDIDSVMQDPKKLRPFMDCYLDKQPCSDQAAGFKKHFFDILGNACSDCDEKMKHITEEFILDVLVNYPDDAMLLKSKYDPDGTKFSKLAIEVSKY